MRPIIKIIVHCSDTETGDVKSIDRFHKEVRGWDSIGYHYVIVRNGDLQEGRPLWKSGAHCSGENENSIGVCLIGKTEFTLKQLEVLKFLIEDLKSRFKSIKEVRGHRDYRSAKKQGKTCPGDNVIAYMEKEKLYE